MEKKDIQQQEEEQQKLQLKKLLQCIIKNSDKYLLIQAFTNPSYRITHPSVKNDNEEFKSQGKSLFDRLFSVFLSHYFQDFEPLSIMVQELKNDFYTPTGLGYLFTSYISQRILSAEQKQSLNDTGRVFLALMYAFYLTISEVDEKQKEYIIKEINNNSKLLFSNQTKPQELDFEDIYHDQLELILANLLKPLFYQLVTLNLVNFYLKYPENVQLNLNESSKTKLFEKAQKFFLLKVQPLELQSELKKYLNNFGMELSYNDQNQIQTNNNNNQNNQTQTSCEVSITFLEQNLYVQGQDNLSEEFMKDLLSGHLLQIFNKLKFEQYVQFVQLQKDEQEDKKTEIQNPDI